MASKDTLDYVVRTRRTRPGYEPFCCSDGSRTQQHFEPECNINGILEKFSTTGTLVDPMVPRTRSAMSGDFRGIPSNFQELQNTLIEAQKSFMSVPAKIRQRFNNDAGEFVRFFENPENRQECISMGLIPETKPTPPAAVIPPSAASGEGNKV